MSAAPGHGTRTLSIHYLHRPTCIVRDLHYAGGYEANLAIRDQLLSLSPDLPAYDRGASSSLRVLPSRALHQLSVLSCSESSKTKQESKQVVSTLAQIESAYRIASCQNMPPSG